MNFVYNEVFASIVGDKYYELPSVVRTVTAYGHSKQHFNTKIAKARSCWYNFDMNHLGNHAYIDGHIEIICCEIKVQLS